MATNLPTFGISDAAVTARNAEFVDTPLSDIVGDGTYEDPYLGMNRAGSCAPAIGINTGNVFQTAAEVAAGARPESWTELDQDEAARIPQNSQHLGGIVDTAPEYEGVPYPSPAEVGTPPVQILDMTEGAVDINDTANFVITDTAAADGAVMDTVSGAINRTGVTVGIGDLVWGPVPVA